MTPSKTQTLAGPTLGKAILGKIHNHNSRKSIHYFFITLVWFFNLSHKFVSSWFGVGKNINEYEQSHQIKIWSIPQPELDPS